MNTLNDVVLKSEDGKFSCVGSVAVELAYMLSNAESIIDMDSPTEDDVRYMISSYLTGHKSVEEVNNIFKEWINEIREEQANAVV